MKFLLNHNVPDDAAFSLEALGHVVVELQVNDARRRWTDAGEVCVCRRAWLRANRRDDFLAGAGRFRAHGISCSSAQVPALERRRWSGLWIPPGIRSLSSNINFA